MSSQGVGADPLDDFELDDEFPLAIDDEVMQGVRERRRALPPFVHPTPQSPLGPSSHSELPLELVGEVVELPLLNRVARPALRRRANSARSVVTSTPTHFAIRTRGASAEFSESLAAYLARPRAAAMMPPPPPPPPANLRLPPSLTPAPTMLVRVARVRDSIEGKAHT